MKKDEMIKDMRAIIRREHSDCMSNLCENCEYYAMNFCGSAKTATALYNAGYRKVTEDEIVESMKTYERARNETAREILGELWDKRWSLTDLQFAICDMLAEYDIELKNTTYSRGKDNE